MYARSITLLIRLAKKKTETKACVRVEAGTYCLPHYLVRLRLLMMSNGFWLLSLSIKPWHLTQLRESIESDVNFRRSQPSDVSVITFNDTRSKKLNTQYSNARCCFMCHDWWTCSSFDENGTRKFILHNAMCWFMNTYEWEVERETL